MKNKETKKEYDNVYLKISKYSLMQENKHSILVGDILEDEWGFWVSKKNVFKNEFCNDSILTISINLADDKPINISDRCKFKKEIKRSDLLENYKNFVRNIVTSKNIETNDLLKTRDFMILKELALQDKYTLDLVTNKKEKINESNFITNKGR